MVSYNAEDLYLEYGTVVKKMNCHYVYSKNAF